MKKIGSLILLVLYSWRLCATGMSVCELIYWHPDVRAKYAGTETALGIYEREGSPLWHYAQLTVAPTIKKCMPADWVLVDSLKIDLVIDNTGKVTDAQFPYPQIITSDCMHELRKQFLIMTGWQAAKNGGRPVCSYHRYLIRNIRHMNSE